MILGGAMGNLVDRFFRSPGPLRGHVVDFLSVGWWPVFNVADPSVVGGAILLVTLSVFGFDFDSVGRRSTGGALDPTDAPDVVETPVEPAEGADEHG
jgi:signal peptidase II